jgi:hypothetical protein
MHYALRSGFFYFRNIVIAGMTHNPMRGIAIPFDIDALTSPKTAYCRRFSACKSSCQTWNCYITPTAKCLKKFQPVRNPYRLKFLRFLRNPLHNFLRRNIIRPVWKKQNERKILKGGPICLAW